MTFPRGHVLTVRLRFGTTAVDQPFDQHRIEPVDEHLVEEQLVQRLVEAAGEWPVARLGRVGVVPTRAFVLGNARIEFARHAEEARPLSGEELGDLARRMVEAKDPAEAGRLQKEIVRGFYGGQPHA